MIGPRRIEQRIAQLAQHLKQGIADAGFNLLTPMAPEFSHGVCIVKLDPARRGEIIDRLYREHGIAGAATGGLRLCPTIYNTLEHVDRAVAGVKALLA